MALIIATALATAFPGPAHLHPKLHYAADIVSMHASWHDVAGALTHKGVHHVWQGQGWNHAFSSDLVHWQAGAHGPKAVHETYKGMDSNTDPCSGFATVDDDGTVCAGFRQCGSSKGIQAPGYHDWDVPLEVRCALNDNLTAWNDASPEYLFNVSFYRPVPYDPARPWKESDGNWYVMLSFDHCNVTTKKSPCPEGGMLVMWKSPALRGPKADWQYVGPVFTSNATVIPGAFLEKEFVTIDYIGSLKGDPKANGATRLFLNNVGGNGGGVGCCSGTTSFFVVEQAAPGAPLVEVGPQGMVDWGSFAVKPSSLRRRGGGIDAATASGSSGGMGAWPGIEHLDGTKSRGFSMARTLGSEEADQVTKPGRKVLIGWTGPADGSTPYIKNYASAQSLPRELSLGPDRSLRQAFVSELQILRDVHTSVTGKQAWFPVPAGLQAEVLATLPSSCSAAAAMCGVSILGDGVNATTVTLAPDLGLVMVDGTAQGNPYVRAGPLPPPTPSGEFAIHLYADHSIIELIVNNVTALVVYVAPSPSAGRVQLVGMPAKADGAKLDVWTLKSANNE